MAFPESFIDELVARNPIEDVVGQVVNLSAMAGEVGVSSTTLREWLTLLEASYIVFTLQQHFLQRISGAHIGFQCERTIVKPGSAPFFVVSI